MGCKKCGAPTVEGAVFCGNCGARLDGKKPCSFCEQLNDEDNAYCVFCGARIDGKKVCSCGTAYSGAFCPQCGSSNRVPAKKEIRKKTFSQTSGVNDDGALCQKAKWKVVLDYVGSGIAMLGVLFALIFVFFIGVKAGGVGSDVEEKETIFYYFGKYYRETKNLLPGANWFSKLMASNLTVYGVMGTVIGAVALLSVTTFATIACILFVRNMMGISEEKADRWAMATVFSFFICASAFFALHRSGVTFEGRYAEEIQETLMKELGVSVGFTTATKLGIIFCAIFVGVFVLCRLIAKGKALFNARCVVKLVCATITVALATTVFLLVKNAGTAVEISVFDDRALQAEVEIGIKLNYLNTTSLMNILSVNGGTNYQKVTTALDIMRYSNTFAQISLFVALVGVGGVICTNVNHASENGTSSGVAWAIVGLVGAVALLVCTIVSYGQLAQLFKWLDFTTEEGVRIDTKLAGVVCAVVFATVNLVATCVARLFYRKEKEEIGLVY